MSQMLNISILIMWTYSEGSSLLRMLSAGLRISFPDPIMSADGLKMIILRVIYHFLQHMRGLCAIFIFHCHYM